MKKATVLKLLGGPTGDRKLVAQRLGIAEKSITNWQTDDQGNLLERKVLDVILATLTREHVMRMVRGQASPDEPSEVTWEVLIELCELPVPEGAREGEEQSS